MVEFSVFLDNCEIEPGDTVGVTHAIDGITGLTCDIVSSRQVVGSGRDNRADCLQMTAIENDGAIAMANYTSPAGYDLKSNGAVTIPAGVTVTIGANSTWVIL